MEGDFDNLNELPEETTVCALCGTDCGSWASLLKHTVDNHA